MPLFFFLSKAMRNTLKHYLILILVFSLGAALVHVSGRNRTVVDAKSQPSLVPPNQLKYFTFGYSENIGDMLWLRTIQDFDYCENRPYDENANQLIPAQCERGWVYHMVDSVTELEPNFHTAFLTGGLFLSVIVNDKNGASDIYRKGVAQFPHDWQMAYFAAYHEMAEQKNLERASELLISAAQNGAPSWVYALAARLRAKEGQLTLAKSILESALQLNPDEMGAKRIRQRLDEVNAEIAKQEAQDKSQSAKH